MTDIVAIYVAANEGRNIAESMRSVAAYVDRFVVIDSIFPSNPAPSTHSTDGQREEAERIAGGRLAYFQSGSKITETAARNLALTYLEPGDYGLIIDGDECLYGDHAEMEFIVGAMRSGIPSSIAIHVYTTAILHEGDAPTVTAREHADAPIVSTYGLMIRFFRMDEGVHYELPSGHITPMLTDAEGVVLMPGMESTAFIINRHATQPFDVYQEDYVWQTGARQP